MSYCSVLWQLQCAAQSWAGQLLPPAGRRRQARPLLWILYECIWIIAKTQYYGWRVKTAGKVQDMLHLIKDELYIKHLQKDEEVCVSSMYLSLKGNVSYLHTDDNSSIIFCCFLFLLLYRTHSPWTSRSMKEAGTRIEHFVIIWCQQQNKKERVEKWCWTNVSTWLSSVYSNAPHYPEEACHVETVDMLFLFFFAL